MRPVWRCACYLVFAAMLLLGPAPCLAAEWFQSAGIAGPVVDVVVQGGTSHYLVAAAQGTNPGIYRSGNGGMTFTKVATFTRPFRLHDVGGMVFAATSQGLYKSSNLTSWTAVGGGLPAGKSVSYVGRSNPWGANMYATVAAGTTRGLYRSTNTGTTWQRVLPNAGTKATAQCEQCGGPENTTVFAGGQLSPGGPSCTMQVSYDNGSTWSCTTFPYSVNDIRIDPYNGGANWKHVYVTSGDANAVYRSTDYGVSFAVDGTGITDCCASNISQTGGEVGALSAGLFTRNYGPIGTPWTSFDTTGLTDTRINRWLRFDGTVSDYVVATPSGVFYYGDMEPPCETPPCP